MSRRRHKRVTMVANFQCAGIFLFFISLSAVAKDDCAWPHEMPSAKIVLIGEVHGTEEAPGFIGSLACAGSMKSKNLVVALEISSSEQPLIDTYMDSRGSRNDKSRFLSGKFWARKSQDGRSSTAMFGLVERLRKLKRSGVSISVVAVDDTINGSRDTGMAMHIERAASSPDTSVIALLGNYHASQSMGSSWDPNYKPAGFQLLALDPLSVLFSAQAGSAWVCTPSCGVLVRKSDGKVQSTVGYIANATTETGYNGTFSIKFSTASLPAVRQPDRIPVSVK